VVATPAMVPSEHEVMYDVSGGGDKSGSKRQSTGSQIKSARRDEFSTTNHARAASSVVVANAERV